MLSSFLCAHLLFRLWAHQVQEKQMWRFRSYPISTTIFQSRGLWLLLIPIRWEEWVSEWKRERERENERMHPCIEWTWGDGKKRAETAWKDNGDFCLYGNLIVVIQYKTKLMSYWVILGLWPDCIEENIKTILYF